MKLVRILLPFSILLLCNFWGCPNDGKQGVQGIQGVQGVAGPTGPQGQAGTNGLGSLHAIDNEGTDIGYVLDVEGNRIKVWNTNLSEIRFYDRETADDITGQLSENIKIYFPTEDCSGQPYTYATATLPGIIYKTNFEGGKYLKTESTRTSLFIPKAVHAGTSECATEGATYDLYEAEWWPGFAGPDYVPTITIEVR
jgi:hypothetical protein